MIREFIIPPSSARAFTLPKGRAITITDLHGSQVSDFIAIATKDVREKFDQDRTRVNNWSNKVTKGTVLYSNRNNRILEVVEDSVGVHDMLFPCCNTFVYENIFHLPPRKGCFENLAEAVHQYGAKGDDLPNPLNMFMNTFLNSETGEIRIGQAASRPGDSIKLKALVDLVVAATACADDVSECNAGKCKPIKVEIDE
jgi:uncharacterized protein